ncbi:MBL fold metallo-hydrolase [Tissierella carlieri]|uniref:MBL fold metallo-hydrolase n=1 Tax=Tissierella carlieri TaxID=689904 RepID=A0ABT1S600_9FIRM|nr:MBL fold metallo-hydrolase [Tissierella carlieri]MBU5314129.1 MBL fold metallo-hydrolase [Tissierella carlieri]MCQ4921890.1 MBL fold metallo-hydrolase [Tissierella carlieri]
MKIIRIPAGIYAANCYVIYSEATRDGIVVDPGGDVDEILTSVRENQLKIKYIVLTHGHADHIGGIINLKKALPASVMIHEEDREMLIDGSKNLSTMMAMGTIEIEPDLLLKDGDIIEFGDEKAEIIHTPGHTKGGICIKIGDNIITGDTLFAGSIGRTDLPGGDYETIIKSIKDKLLIYLDDVQVFPGHGAPSTIGRERVSNPFLR